MEPDRKRLEIVTGKSYDTCLVAEHQNKVTGTATALNHSNEVAWIGMVLVDKSLRGQGAGKMLMTHLLDKQIFGVDRTYLLEALFRNYPGKAFMFERNN